MGCKMDLAHHVLRVLASWRETTARSGPVRDVIDCTAT